LRILPDEAPRPLHLTYCTNIHAADGWEAVEANLARYAPVLKARFSPDAPFGIGLRLGARDARELLDGRLDAFRAWLDGHGMYVAIINGFPFGSFHRTAVKADVYAPDWRDPARVAYTQDLVTILARLVPDGLDGGVSTAPLSYKAWMRPASPADWLTIVRNVASVAETLVRVREQTGPVIHLDIEPEPDCLLENTDETIAFFEDRLLPQGAPLLAKTVGVTTARAADLLREHIRVCFDCCHFAVEYEDPLVALERLAAAGVRIGRIQLSSALDVAVPADRGEAAAVVKRLRPFADSTYLHQVVTERGEVFTHYPDLTPALDHAVDGHARQMRIHFHVPLFTAEYDGLSSTQAYVRTVIEAARTRAFTTHLEIETYTWDVLPGPLKADLGDSIAREYEWVLGQLR
jgi:sugar phosphate isomerase/epimerase